MSYYNTNISQGSKPESSVNIQFFWTTEIGNYLSKINQFNSFCYRGGYNFLVDLKSELATLVDFIAANIDTIKQDVQEVDGKKVIFEKEYIDTRLSDIELMLRKFKMLEDNKNIPLKNKMFLINKRGFEIHQKLKEVYRILMQELENNRILRYIKMDVKEMARQQWHGDS